MAKRRTSRQIKQSAERLHRTHAETQKRRQQLRSTASAEWTWERETPELTFKPALNPRSLAIAGGGGDASAASAATTRKKSNGKRKKKKTATPSTSSAPAAVAEGHAGRQPAAVAPRPSWAKGRTRSRTFTLHICPNPFLLIDGPTTIRVPAQSLAELQAATAKRLGMTGDDANVLLCPGSVERLVDAAPLRALAELGSEETIGVFPLRCFEGDGVTPRLDISSGGAPAAAAAAGTAKTDDAAAAGALAEEDVATWLSSVPWLSAMDASHALRKMHENLVETVGDLRFAAGSAEQLASAPFGVPHADRLWAELAVCDGR